MMLLKGNKIKLAGLVRKVKDSEEVGTELSSSHPGTHFPSQQDLEAGRSSPETAGASMSLIVTL